MLTEVAVTLIGTPRGAPALLGVSWSRAGTAFLTVSSKLRIAPAGIDTSSHSTPPALSTGSPTTLLLKVGAALAAAFSTFGQTSVASEPHGRASYFDHGGEVEVPPVTSAKPPELPVSAFVPPMKRGGPSV